MKKPSLLTLLLVALLALLLTGCGTKRIPSQPQPQPPAKRPPPSTAVPPTQRPYVIMGRTYYPLPSAEGFVETGVASWYGPNFHGRKTANGETYDMNAVSAAHKTLPMNTYLLVKNLENDREIVVRVNDRGPFAKERIIDLSKAAAEKIGMIGKGTARVQIAAMGEAQNFGTADRRIERFLPHQDFQAGEFYVQIGSFTEKSNADRLKDKMLSWGRKAVVETYDRGDALFYRVQVRAGTRLTEAKHMETVMEESGYPGFVVAR